MLEKAGKWLNELGIITQLYPNCLKVCRQDVIAFGETTDVLLGEIRKAVGHNKLFWANQDTNWLYIETF